MAYEAFSARWHHLCERSGVASATEGSRVAWSDLLGVPVSFVGTSCLAGTSETFCIPAALEPTQLICEFSLFRNHVVVSGLSYRRAYSRRKS